MIRKTWFSTQNIIILYLYLYFILFVCLCLINKQKTRYMIIKVNLVYNTNCEQLNGCVHSHIALDFRFGLGVECSIYDEL